MNKEIEEGCRAVIVNTKINNGKIVVVGKYIGDVGNSFNHSMHHWEVDTLISYTGGGKFMHIDAHFLNRIDDEELGSWEEIEALCNWNPSKESINATD